MSLIKRSELLEFAHNHVGGVIDCNDIARFPAVDAVNVVRCRDCVSYTRSPFGHSFIGWCKLDTKHRNQNFYCADGEMKPK